MLEMTVREGVPPVINPPEMAELARQAAASVVGEENAVPLHTANMGGEDFSQFHNTKEKVPTFMFNLGTVEADRLKKMEEEGHVPGLHSPFYYPDPTETIRTGITAMSAGVLEIMKKK